MCILLHLELKFRVIQTRIISLRLRVRCEKPRNNCQTPVQCLSTKVLVCLFGIFLANMEGENERAESSSANR